jgi:photosystem II stability/assembly factor-like uncharacterized protein
MMINYSWQHLQKISFLLAVFFVPAIFNCTAQVRDVKEPELKQRLQGKTTVAEVMPIVEAFYREKNSININRVAGEFENEYVHWKRWEYNKLHSEGPNGSHFNMNAEKMKVYEQQRQPQNEESLMATPNWTFVGPSASAYVTVPPSGLNGLGRCDRIAFHPTNPDIIYVGTPNGGLWRTNNNGASWTCLTSYLPVAGVSGIVVSYADPNIIYILTGNGDDQNITTITPGIFSSAGIFKTTDGGINWVQLTLPWASTTTFGIAPFKLVQSPRFPNKLLAATSYGLYYSSNGGNTWSTKFTVRCYDVDFVPGKDTAWCAIETGAGTHIKRTTDGGVSWGNVSFGAAPNTPIPNPASRISLAVSNVITGGIELAYIFCGPVTAPGAFSGLYKTGPAGFLQLARNTPNLFAINASGADAYDQSRYDNCIAVNPVNALMVHTGGAAIYRTTDGGSSISINAYYDEPQASGNLEKYVHGDIHDLAYNPLNNFLYAASDGGMYNSKDNGDTWASISNGITSSMFYDIDGLENNQYAILGGLQDNGNKYRSTNTSNLMHIGAFDGFYSALSPSNNLVGYFSANQFLLKENNLGDAVNIGISPSLSPGQWAWRMETDITDGNYLYASTEGIDSIWITNDGAATWFRKRFANGNRAIVTCPSNLNRVYACGTTPIWNLPATSFKRSDDKGDTWTANLIANPGLPPIIDIAPTDVEVSPVNSNNVYVVYSGYNAGQKIYFSNNAGVSFTNISANLPNLYCHTLAIDNSDNLYIGTDYGVFLRPAGSTQWRYYSNNLPRVKVSDLHINRTNGFMYAATYGRGIWKADLFGACENFYLFSGNQTGEKVYEANVIWSVAKLDTMQGTKIMYKTADSTKLLNGFIATDGVIEFRATSAPCGSGFPVLRQITDSSVINVAKLSLPPGNTSDFPFATVTVQKKQGQLSLLINNKQEGNIVVKLADKNGKILQDIFSLTKQSTAQFTKIISLPGLKPGLYYLHLIHDGVLVHYQEYLVE